PGGESTPPSVPGNLNGTATASFSVQLTWYASTDNTVVASYDVIRDSLVLAHVSSPGYTDNTVHAGEIHTYAVRARDAWGNVSALSTSAAVMTPVPDDFSISASPSSVTVVQGQSVSSTVSTAVTSGNAQTMTLSASGLPAGATASFNPSTVTAGGSSTLTIGTTSSTPAGSYTVTVTGTGASATHSTSVSLTVTVPDDFSISPSPTSVTGVQGQRVTSTVSTAVTSGNAQTMPLSASCLPVPYTAPFRPSTVTAGGSSTLTIGTTSSTPAGSYTLTVTGTGASATHSTSVSLTVTMPDDFSISASPSSVTVVQGQSVTSTVSTTVTSGNAQTMTLSASGLPAGATASFNPGSVTAGGSPTLPTRRSSDLPAGSYTLTVTGTGASATHSTSVSLTVTAPLSGPRFVQTAAAGESASSTTLTATFPTPTGAGHLLVLAASVYTGATNPISKVTDPAGNTWTKIGAYCTAGHFSDGELWYWANANSVTSVTVTVAAAAVIAIEVNEFSGVATTNPLDVSGGASNTGDRKSVV